MPKVQLASGKNDRKTFQGMRVERGHFRGQQSDKAGGCTERALEGSKPSGSESQSPRGWGVGWGGLPQRGVSWVGTSVLGGWSTVCSGAFW